ncbi:MAG: dihydropteroate synthase [Candidatus Aminicenantes bacterium]|nr:dihydropteroate synthase [Candidatus Aminicenantes bacterium]
MGVLNVTPDSFSDGGIYFERKKAVSRGLDMAAAGADIIDIGGESTRPGSDPVSPEAEKERVIPVISELRRQTEVLISIDTTKSQVAQAALDAGADMINDISAFRFDPEMAGLAAQKKVPVVLMHMKGVPKTMQKAPTYKDVVNEVEGFLAERVEFATAHGIERNKIIIDPGIGFGKRLEDNLELLYNLDCLKKLNRPILVGASRKSFIGTILDLPPKERLEGTIASAVLCIARGAHILRVHDVIAVRRAALVADAIINRKPSFSPPCEEVRKDTHAA